VDRLSVLQVVVADRWVWKLPSSRRYTINGAYNNLAAAEVVYNEGFNHALWLKVVRLKVNIFIWSLFLNHLATNDNLFR